MQNIRTLYDEALQNCHSERSEESNAETLRGVYPERSRRAQGDNPSVSILCSLIYETTAVKMRGVILSWNAVEAKNLGLQAAG